MATPQTATARAVTHWSSPAFLVAAVLLMAVGGLLYLELEPQVYIMSALVSIFLVIGLGGLFVSIVGRASVLVRLGGGGALIALVAAMSVLVLIVVVDIIGAEVPGILLLILIVALPGGLALALLAFGGAMRRGTVPGNVGGSLIAAGGIFLVLMVHDLLRYGFGWSGVLELSMAALGLLAVIFLLVGVRLR